MWSCHYRTTDYSLAGSVLQERSDVSRSLNETNSNPKHGPHIVAPSPTSLGRAIYSSRTSQSAWFRFADAVDIKIMDREACKPWLQCIDQFAGEWSPSQPSHQQSEKMHSSDGTVLLGLLNTCALSKHHGAISEDRGQGKSMLIEQRALWSQVDLVKWACPQL